MKSFSFTFLLSIISFVAFSQNSEIKVNVSGFRTDNGKCILYLFNGKKGFPSEAQKAFKTVSSRIAFGKATIVLKDIPDGEYAITVVHDENDNNKMETNFIGIPKEGVGVSNNVKSTIGPPGYSDAKFMVSKKSLVANIIVSYL